MEIMHPNHSKMIAMAINFLQLNTQNLKALNVGIETGFCTQKFLEKFPKAHITGVDGSSTMINLAKTRLESSFSSVDFVKTDSV